MKFFLCVLAVFKNEGHAIDEWVRHYIREGVEHFYLIDNGSNDNFREKISKGDYKDNISLFHDTRVGAQIDLYNTFMMPRINDTEWVIVCDLDEFMYGTRGRSIRDILKSIADSNIGGIEIPWTAYGSSGHVKQPNSIVKNFKMRDDYSQEKKIEVKSIVKTNALEAFRIHSHTYKHGYIIVNEKLQARNPDDFSANSQESLNEAHIKMNHYRIQSLNFFKSVKMTRGAADRLSNDYRNEQYFKSEDTSIVEDMELYKKHQDLYDFIDSNNTITEFFYQKRRHRKDIMLIIAVVVVVIALYILFYIVNNTV